MAALTKEQILQAKVSKNFKRLMNKAEDESLLTIWSEALKVRSVRRTLTEQVKLHKSVAKATTAGLEL